MKNPRPRYTGWDLGQRLGDTAKGKASRPRTWQTHTPTPRSEIPWEQGHDLGRTRRGDPRFSTEDRLQEEVDKGARETQGQHRCINDAGP